MKVLQFYNKNQLIIDNKTNVWFQSYDSMIANYNYVNKKMVIGPNWDYSRTTLKHFYLFIKDYVTDPTILEVLNKKNKKNYIQKLIDVRVIKFNPKL